MQKHAFDSGVGPIELEVIHGTIRAAELEIEVAVERTARSPMIRDQHDYRVALFDAKGRKLTGRSYSAIVEPIFKYFGEGDIHPGDVFFWNDPYNSCGGIGHVWIGHDALRTTQRSRRRGSARVADHNCTPGLSPWLRGLA